MFWLGTFIGLTFEIPFNLLGDGFLTVLIDWPLPRITVNICHSFWDGLLFAGGAAVCRLALGSYDFLTTFDYRALAIQTIWGAGLAFVVELANNGVLWLYQPKPYNPTMVTINGIEYTAMVEVIWLIIPTIFYLSTLAINRRLVLTGPVGQ